MTDEDLPTLPTELRVIELSDATTGRSCAGCGADADFYAIVTDAMANERLGTDLAHDEWPVNAMLCRSCFGECPRVASWDDLPLKASGN